MWNFYSNCNFLQCPLFPLNFQFSLGFILILLFLAIVIGEHFDIVLYTNK